MPARRARLHDRLTATALVAAAVLAGILTTARAANATDTPERNVRVPQVWIRWLPANLPAGGTLRIAASVRSPDGTPAARTAPGSMPGMPDMSGMPGLSNTPK